MYDLVVIGAGVAGYTAAIKAAKEGMKVAVVEKKKVGGTCLNKGCIPTKYLIHTATVFNEAQKFIGNGIADGSIEFNYEKLLEDMTGKVGRLSAGIQSLIRANKIECFSGDAEIIDENRVIVNKEETLQAKYIFIATGSAPKIPKIEGAELRGVYTTDDIFDSMSKLPKTMLIIGGGVVGLEMAFLYCSLGVKVTVVECRERLLENMDEDVENLLLKSLSQSRVEVYFGSRVSEIFDEDGLQVAIRHMEKNKILETEAVLFASGRSPVVQNIGIENTGIEVRDGYIVTDDCCRTNVKNIYAIGDVNGKAMTAYGATAQAINAVNHICGKEMGKSDIIPMCIFSKPEVAIVGLTETMAGEQGYDVAVGKFLMSANGRSVMENQEGFVKIVSDKKTDTILGAVCVCHLATELINQITIAMNAKMTMKELRKANFLHPTYSEGIAEASEMMEGKSVYML